MVDRPPRPHHKAAPFDLPTHVGSKVMANGVGLAWSDITVQLLAHEANQPAVIVPAVAEPLLAWVASGRATVDERDLGGVWQSSSVQEGDFFLTHSTEPYEMRWEAHGPAPFQVAHVYLSSALLEVAASEVTGRKEVPSLGEVSGGRDELISSLLNVLVGELRAPRASSMLVRGTAGALAVHLIRRYQSENGRRHHPSSLPAAKLRRTIDRMLSTLEQDFSLPELAADAGMSEAYFSRMFKKATGLSPSQYAIRLKMQQAQRLLRETNMPIIEVALDVGYASPSHFSQVFRREIGVTPRDYRSH